MPSSMFGTKLKPIDHKLQGRLTRAQREHIVNENKDYAFDGLAEIREPLKHSEE